MGRRRRAALARFERRAAPRLERIFSLHARQGGARRARHRAGARRRAQRDLRTLPRFDAGLPGMGERAALRSSARRAAPCGAPRARRHLLFFGAAGNSALARFQARRARRLRARGTRLHEEDRRRLPHPREERTFALGRSGVRKENSRRDF